MALVEHSDAELYVRVLASRGRTRRVRAAAQLSGLGARREPQHDALNAWIGRWINEDHRIRTVPHERTDGGLTYKPSMRVTLIKVK